MDKNKINQIKILKDVSAINGNMLDLPRSLEMLNTTADVDVQVKLFSIVSAYLMLNDANVAAIITYNPLYDKICKILTNGHPRKTTVVFNFLSALLYIDQDNHRQKSLVAYAKNMIRSSGCLATMCDMFTSCMMHQDAWRALCRCLAEACREIEANQSYCTHLIPMCVQRCCLRNIEVLQVLQSLLQNHKRNISLFVECNGILLFQREFLQHDVCLQLLATIAQSSSQVVSLIVKTNICQQLRDFLHLYEPQSQLNQWATIILYHTSRAEASYAGPKDGESKIINYELDQTRFTKIDPKSQNQVLECSGDTTKFYQNVMKEIIHCGAQDNFKKAFLPSNVSMTNQRNAFYIAPGVPIHNTSQRNKVGMTTHQINNSHIENEIQTNSLQFNTTNELSFSFLRKQHLKHRHATSTFDEAEKQSDSFQRTLQTNTSNVIKNIAGKTFKVNSTICLDFKPKFASTPKKIRKKEHSRYEKQHYNTIKNAQIKRELLASKRVLKHLERTDNGKEIKHRSISGRVFDVINTSCSTLMNTVKNIFRPKSVNKDKSDFSNESSNRESFSAQCSYSFTNYMRDRDARLNNKTSTKSHYDVASFKSKGSFEDFSMDITNNSCNTCNNTVILKRKLTNDNHLKQTIRKLKLGINLYGCDFKKISRVMWPNERYMTPAVIYNLYRKLIIK